MRHVHVCHAHQGNRTDQWDRWSDGSRDERMTEVNNVCVCVAAQWARGVGSGLRAVVEL